MKNPITPTDREVTMQAGDFIVSKTDLKGRITYANRIFMQIAGYDERELLGRQHNIVRHPDMPRGVYRLLWQTIEGGDECFAYVKNLCKGGDFYWVFATITVDYDRDGRPAGYYSVRRQPSRAALAAIEPVYREMLEIERRAGPRDAPTRSVEWLQAQIAARGARSYSDFIQGLLHAA